MATTSQDTDNRPQLNQPLAIAIAVVVLVVLITFLYRQFFMTPAAQLAPLQSPYPQWVHDDAYQSKGDITKLPAAEQQKLKDKYPNGAQNIIEMEYRMTGGGQ